MVIVLDILSPDKEEVAPKKSEVTEQPKETLVDMQRLTRVQVISITGELVDMYV
jgi:hypothetical protein